VLEHLQIPHNAILSGDHAKAVQRVAQTIGIKTALHSQSPADKLAWIQARQAEGRSVLMLGDGLNDAPTLAAADVSVSFSNATILAQTQSDFLILNDKLDSLIYARTIAQHTRRIIHQNLIWAASYNLIMIPAAALGWIPPWGAAIGMSLSSLLVVLNSLRRVPYTHSKIN
jgi:Cu2+-exporting ATPase